MMIFLPSVSSFLSFFLLLLNCCWCKVGYGYGEMCTEKNRAKQNRTEQTGVMDLLLLLLLLLFFLFFLVPFISFHFSFCFTLFFTFLYLSVFCFSLFSPKNISRRLPLPMSVQLSQVKSSQAKPSQVKSSKTVSSSKPKLSHL